MMTPESMLPALQLTMYHGSTKYGYEVPGMILLRDTKGAM